MPMSRRPATFFTALMLISAGALALAGCGGKEAAPPTPGTASAPAATPQPETLVPDIAAVASPTPAPAEAPPAAPAAPSAPAASAPQAEPATTPGTSEPGAIPPAAAVDPNAKPADKPVDALQWLADSEARKVDYQRRMGEAEANLAVANASVADWERTVLAFHNPFRPRPQLSPEDASAIASMDGKARVEWGDGRLATARAARDAAQKALDDLKANPPQN